MQIETPQKRILLVEDEAIIAMAEKRTLERYGFRVLTTCTGEAAVELVESGHSRGVPIDLILMDIDLGRGIDGTEAAQRILEHHDIPLIFLSSHTEPEVVEKTEGITSYGYIVKNSGETVLIASVKMAFRLFEARMKELEKEAALQRSEERLFLAMEAATDGLWDWDLRTDTIYWSPRSFRMLGYEPDEFVVTSEKWRELVHPEDVGEAWRVVEGNLSDQGSNFRMEFRYRTKQGGWVWITGRGKPVAWDHAGRLVRMVGTHTDITAQKEAEGYRELTSEILTFLNTPAGLRDSLGDVLSAVRRVTRAEAAGIRLQQNEDSIVAQDPPGANCFAIGGTPDPECTCGLLLSGKFDPDSPFFTAGGSFCMNDGSTLLSLSRDEDPRTCPRNRCIPEGYLSLVFVPIRAEGKIVGLLQLNGVKKNMFSLETVRAMEEIASHIGSALLRGQMEERLRSSEERFRKLLENIPSIAVQRYDAEGIIRYWNRASEGLYGFTAGEAVGKSMFDLTVAPGMAGEVRENMKLMAETGRPLVPKEHLMRRRDGSLVTVYSSHAVVKDPEGNPELFSIDIDITERERMAKRIQDLLREKELLLKETHHRLKNNMSVVSSLLRLQADTQAGAENALSCSCADILEDAAARVQSMAVLFDKLYRSGEYRSLSAAEFLPPLAREIIDSFPSGEGIDAAIEVEDFPLAVKKLSPLGIIVNELISNSMKHAFCGRNFRDGSRRAEISISVGKRDRTVTLVYSDNGPGLPESVSLESPSTFGLQLLRLLADQIGGKIFPGKAVSGESIPGEKKGAAFVIQLETE